MIQRIIVSLLLSVILLGISLLIELADAHDNPSTGVRHRYGLIQRKLEENEKVAVSSSSSSGCSSTPNYGGRCDVTTQDGNDCGYQHVYKGCALLEEDLKCLPTLTCTCNALFDETWACLANAMSDICPDGIIGSEKRGKFCTPISTDNEGVAEAEAEAETVEKVDGTILQQQQQDTDTDTGSNSDNDMNDGIDLSSATATAMTDNETDTNIDVNSGIDLVGVDAVDNPAVDEINAGDVAVAVVDNDSSSTTTAVANTGEGTVTMVGAVGIEVPITATTTDSESSLSQSSQQESLANVAMTTADATALTTEAPIVATTTTATGDSTSSSTTNNNPNSNNNAAIVPISFYGLNYNTRKGPDWFADRERCKSRDEVVRDLTVLARVTTRIRLLALVDCDQGRLVWSILNQELASTNMQMWLGLWVGPDPIVFQQELDALEVILQDSTATNTDTVEKNYDFSHLLGISVGSEAIYREDVTVQEAIDNMEATQTLLTKYNVQNIPTTIVEIAPIYSQSQQLRNSVDTIMTNTFPFWESIPVDNAVDNLDENLSWLLGLPELENKPFVLGEHGWPSDGYIDGVGVASPNNQQQYMKDSYCYLQVDKSYPYYLFTSIDNDWRQLQDPNNTIEGNWGFLQSDLTLKSHFVDYEFTCDNDIENGVTTTYSFGLVDWSIPELPDIEIDTTTSSCQLWSGCEALAGDCCPTPNQDYLGCCRDEFFLGSTSSSDSGTSTTDTTGDDLSSSSSNVVDVIVDVPKDVNVVSTTAPSIAPVPAIVEVATTAPSTVYAPVAATVAVAATTTPSTASVPATTTIVTTSSPANNVVVSPTDAPTIKSSSSTTTPTITTMIPPTLAPISISSINSSTTTESSVIIADPVDIIDTTTTMTTTPSTGPTAAPFVTAISKDGTVNSTRESGETQTTTTIDPWNENKINSSEVSSLDAAAAAANGGIGGNSMGGAMVTATAYIVVVVVVAML